MKHTRNALHLIFLQQNSNNILGIAAVHILRCRICYTRNIILKVLLPLYFNTVKLKKQYINTN